MKIPRNIITPYAYNKAKKISICNGVKRRFLIVSPHPDDAELGIGGTMIGEKQKGHKVFLVDLTWGEPTPFGTVEKRKRESARASRILKLDGRMNLGLENRYLNDTKDARLLLAEKIRLLRPDIVLCPHPEDAHPDHVAASKITEGARFYAKYTKVALKGKPHYPFYLFYYFCSHLRKVASFSFLLDISEQFMIKMKAVRCYRSQFIDNPKNKFVFDYVEGLNRYLGTLIHVRYAEAIYSKEAIKLESLNSSL